MAKIACHKAVTMAAVALLCFASGCAALAEGEIARIQAAHGVSIDVTVAAGANDLLGGNSLVLLWNVEKELEVFPQRFKQGMRIHIAGNLDLLAESHTLEEALSAPLTIAAVQQYAGKTQGDIYVLNKGLLGSYMEIFQPGTTMWEDPHLRHEIMHAYEVNTLTRTLFTAKYQKVLDEPVGKYDPMTYKLACIDSVSLIAGQDEIASQDAVFGRKIEIMAVLMASLESPEKLNARFEKAYAEQITR